MDTPYQLLIVEDDADTSAMLQEFLSRQGYEVHVAAWGQDAIAQCQHNPPALIVLDVRLPDIDGYEVCARLRQQFRTRHTPVIFLTERRSRDDKITGLQLGAVDYMTKPFDVQELLLRVRNALRLAEQRHIVNPVTNLPIGQEVEDRLRSLVGRGEWAALYIRLKKLESFGEAHGFVASSEVLRTVSDTVNDIVAQMGGDQDFVGHLSEADFVLVTSPGRVEALQEEIMARLPGALRPFVASSLEGARNSNPVSPPFSVAIGLLTSTDFPPGDEQDIGRKLAGDDLPLGS